jgi:hypothetical protein
MIKASIISLFVTVLLFAPARTADDGRIEVQQTISKQIDAFLNDDADTAYSVAAPGIKNRYPDKDGFFAMVKKSYQPVYRVGNYAFGRYAEPDPGAMAFQEVYITSPDGKDWTAVYKLLHQPDGSWKIGGVGIFPNSESKGI